MSKEDMRSMREQGNQYYFIVSVYRESIRDTEEVLSSFVFIHAEARI